MGNTRSGFAVDGDPRRISPGSDDQGAVQSGQERLPAQDCAVAAPNDVGIVSFFTVRTSADFDGAGRKAVEEALHSRATVWRDDSGTRRSYALVESAAPPSAAELPEGARSYDRPIVAVAIYPVAAQAIDGLLEALGGSGRPAGVLSCEAGDGCAIVEWDPTVTSPALIWNLVDAELRRWGSGRRAKLLSPLPPDVVTAIAAAGLQAPEIAPDRVLETLLERAGLQS